MYSLARGNPVCTPYHVLLRSVLRKHGFAVNVKSTATSEVAFVDVYGQLYVRAQSFEHFLNLLCRSRFGYEVDHNGNSQSRVQRE